MALFPSLFTNQDPQLQELAESKAPPSSAHIFGQDELGRDVYARCIYGARVSIFVGLLVTLGSTVLGVLLGSLAGFYGGWLDTVVSRVTDMFFAIPLTLAAMLILSVVRSRNIVTIAFVLVVLGWTGLVRIMRSAVISTKNADYVQAARALGAGNRRIIVRHVLPNAIAPVIVVATINIGAVIVSEATLSFLGIGLQPPSISWGLMISSAQQLILDYPHLLFFPALFLSATVLSFVLLGDAVRDALDPKLR
jgi:oligopeptide transport system permease protein